MVRRSNGSSAVAITIASGRTNEIVTLACAELEAAAHAREDEVRERRDEDAGLEDRERRIERARVDERGEPPLRREGGAQDAQRLEGRGEHPRGTDHGGREACDALSCRAEARGGEATESGDPLERAQRAPDRDCGGEQARCARGAVREEAGGCFRESCGEHRARRAEGEREAARRARARELVDPRDQEAQGDERSDRDEHAHRDRVRRVAHHDRAGVRHRGVERDRREERAALGAQRDALGPEIDALVAEAEGRGLLLGIVVVGRHGTSLRIVARAANLITSLWA
jgi:hypothetical protein